MQAILITLEKSILAALAELKIPAPVELRFEHPANSAFGDYSSNVAMMILGKKSPDKNGQKNLTVSTYKSPRELAEAIVQQLKLDLKQTPNPDIHEITVAGPGFINFTFSDTYLIKQTTEITQDPQKGIQQVGLGKPVVVEYSSPNIAKPFTIGHLRSTIIGDAVANLLEATGHHVFRDNHLGDWGTQFGKQIYAIKEWGNEAELDQSSEPVKDLVALYIKFHAEAELHPDLNLEAEGRKWFKRLEDGDLEARRLWQKCIDWSMKEFQRIYAQLGVQFTENHGRGYGESFFEDKMTEVVAELREKKLLTESQGAQVIFFADEKYPPLMILKNDGATLYATRDLATDKFRLQRYGADVKVINEVGAEQSLYFQQLYEVEQLLGWYKPGQRFHVKHGHFRFNDKKMSTRKGNVIWLSDVLAEAIKRATELADQKTPGSSTIHAAEVIGIGALKWNDLKRSSIIEIVFDWDEMLSLQGNSGPYMQYTYARCQSVLAKAAQIHSTLDQAKNQLSQSNLKNGEQTALTDKVLNAEETAVLRMLYRFNEVVQQAASELAPHHLANYLFELAQSYNAFYNKHSILGKEGDNQAEETIELRLLITNASAQVIKKGLELLGIQTLEKM